MGKILSVDDSMVMRKIIRGAAETLSYECVEACNGQQGLDVVSEQYQDLSLILLDVNMPVMNGFELLKILKSDERYKHIPVIMVTTESERVHMIQAIKTGASNYVTKPFSPEELAMRIVESLGQASF